MGARPALGDPLVIGGSWSAYWYNGFIYSNDISKGFDVLELSDKAVAGAGGSKVRTLNVQSQESYRG